MNDAAAHPDIPDTESPVVDAFVYVNWKSNDELFSYLSEGWREYFGAGVTRYPRARVVDPLPARMLPNPLAEYVERDDGRGQVTGTDPIGEHIEPHGIARALLCHERAFSLPAVANAMVSTELTRAANEWLIDFASRDSRCSAAILASTQEPEAGAKEIHRLAENERVGAVILSVNSLAKPFGHPIYRPLLRAAAEERLPIVIASGAEAVTDSLAFPTAAGLPGAYTDLAALSSQSLQTHLVSLIGQGVFEDLPDLRVFFAGAGLAWLPALLFRFEANFKGLSRGAPWLKRRPTEYVTTNMRFCTWPLDRPDDPHKLAAFLEPFDGFSDIVCYGSGYPRWDADSVSSIRAMLPQSWHANVLGKTAETTFRWPSAAEAR